MTTIHVKKATLILLLVLLSGCSTTLRQQWYDMKAYYNTFYNAKSYYEQGLEENLRNQTGFNPHELIRIHPPPGEGGEAAFAQAIEKAASVLRNHPNSSFLDDALELIGKSWYYRGDYFAARDNFRDVARNTTRREAWERAVIWEARTYLELGLNSEGIRFLEQMIGGDNEWSFLQEGEESVSLTSGWTPEYLAQARAVLAQLYTARGDYYLAGLQLLFSLERLEETDLAHRAYFHYGQLMEQMGNHAQALSAYEQLLELTPDMEMEFQTLLKRVEVLRAMEREEEALAHLYRMNRSELWTRRRPEIQLQMAQTELALGGTLQAQYRFEAILHNEDLRPDPPVRARAYYELALLHRDLYEDHLTAAAYFDSTARMQVPPEELPGDWDAEALAGSWRTYTDLRQEEQRLDSLLTLSRLPRDQFYERIRELEMALQGDPGDSAADRETVRSREQVFEPTGVSTDTEGSGFLNERNPVQMERGRQLFRQVWGDRPLADDWRRAEAVRLPSPVVESFSEAERGSPAVSPDGNRGIREGTNTASGGLNLEEIPGTEQEQLEMEIERYEILYRIGVHYLVRLDEPDRAREHFLRVWQEAPEGAPRRESLYALADLAISRGEMEEAYRWADTLMAFDPASPHARQLASRLDLPDPAPDRPDPSREMENGFVPVPIEWNLLRPGSGIPPVWPDSTTGPDTGRTPE